ncbi:hypothetical protein PEL8287_03440 [Roseovarius litorisediminis]|uniref:DUF2924 domain-containing protein n=1 Tax=Roseovarius litorisediminis TaxID=1312363 RepID=A0A1Y5TFN6_9RHOB|nr:DUF2924 domain-containing protein [Roseovarius litorisediminis]SLN62789.1 hypothetical protein PEL8287_03440 [Roseovarius litorisediminis]
MPTNHASFEGGSRVDHLAPSKATILRRRIEALGDLDNVALRLAWQSAWGSAAPKGARKRFLMLGIAWKWQAEVFGGFNRELARRLSALEVPDRVPGRLDERGKPKAISIARPLPGTRILRDWQGDRHEVHVTEQGYLWRGKTFGSLSGVAKAMTGVSRNGPKFFGLRDEQRSR